MVRFDIVVKNKKLNDENRRRLNLDKNGEGPYWDAYGHPGSSYWEGANYYYARLIIGTPGKAFDLIIDSGSPMPYVPCQDRCVKCGTHEHFPLNIKDSTSFKNLECEDSFCKEHFRCRHSDDKCSYSISYGEGSAVDGSIIHESIFLNDEYVPVKLGCIETETKLIFAQDADGLMGIDDSEYSLPNQIINYKRENGFPNFGRMIQLCYSQNGGYMEIGNENLPTDLKWTPMGNGRYNWYSVVAMDMKMDGKDLVTGEDFDNAIGNNGIVADIDTGSTDIKLPPILFDAFANVLKNKMTFIWHKSFRDKAICFWHWNLQTMKDTVPTFEITLKDDVVLTLTHENFMYTKKDGRFCTSVHRENYGSKMLLGGSSLKNHFVAIDKENRRIGIKESDCLSRPSEPVPNHIDDINLSNKRLRPQKLIGRYITFENIIWLALLICILEIMQRIYERHKRLLSGRRAERFAAESTEDRPLFDEENTSNSSASGRFQLDGHSEPGYVDV